MASAVLLESRAPSLETPSIISLFFNAVRLRENTPSKTLQQRCRFEICEIPH